MNPRRDGASRLTAVAVSWLPARREEWGSAMVAELAHIEGRVARWHFAAGCVRVALTPQRPRRQGISAWLAIGGLMILLAPPAFAPSTAKGWAPRASWLIGDVLASVTLYGLYLTSLMIVRAHPRAIEPARDTDGTDPLRLVIAIGAAAAAALDAFVLVHYPELRSQGNAGLAGYVATGVVSVVLVTILAGYTWLATVRMRTGSRTAVVARRYGLLGGSVAGLVLVAASPIGVPGVIVWAGAGAIAAVAGHLASRATADVRAGMVAGTWAGIVAGLALFVFGGLILVAGATPHSSTMVAEFHDQVGTMFHDLRSFSIAGSFGLDGDPPLVGALVSLAFVPLLCTGLAAFGATRGDRRITSPRPQADLGR